MTEEDKRILADFPILKDKDIVYLDSTATSQKPESVLKAMDSYYRHDNANPLRGLYELSVKATEDYENAREAVRAFINANSTTEIVFTRNATESLNLVAVSYAETFLKEGDEILITVMEHHSNMLPWQQAAKKTGAVLKYIECEMDGKITEEKYLSYLTDKTKIVSMAHVSNVFGCENEIKRFASLAHERGAIFIADGAQSVPHVPVDVKDLDVDFLAFSGHKMLSGMGIGVLYGKEKYLDKMPPFLYGGEMIEYVTLEGATYAELPHKFEAGTVNAGAAVGLHAAIDYINNIGFDVIKRREDYLTDLCLTKLEDIPHIHVIGDKNHDNHHGIITFTIDDVHPHDVAAILDSHGICVRAGHHCAQPLMKYLGVMSTTRASLSFYNTEEDIERFAEALKVIRREMGYSE
ncbi:MAG: SufS family cysteine desulfurase [Lachnospiraceae bacterium]|nr:SufS family cysteine desulfurase [Lachnospiraceae bacterium]